ncbi:MAG TPA: hypothetical protein VF225_05295 [Gaiellaceae bacterium]
MSERAFGCVVGGRDAGQRRERPQRGFVVEQAGAEALGLGVAAAAAVGQQVVDALARGGQVGRERGQVAAVAVGLVERGEDAAQFAGELAAQAPGRAAALAQRDEVPEDVCEAQLALGVVDEQLDGVAIGHDHAVGVLAEQGLCAVAVAALGDLKQRGLLGGRDRQPACLSRALPAGLVSAPNGA